jgi:hypothetical protein
MSARVDFTSDYMIFFIALFVVVLTIAVLLERHSPTRQKRRKVRHSHTRETSGELID